MKSIFTVFLIILVSGILAQEPVKVKCASLTKKGEKCKAYAMPNSKYCYFHQQGDSVYTCGAKTKKGTPCKIRVKTKGQLCHLHHM